ncbi:membrane protein [Streptomyces virginiae]|uniref:Membrane protein n=1 Tax=Streptomyces virginiae TaxID=1961 RepID=A0A0L8M6T8_STRVG|nr:membrane protein [Streptomyces virginiae]
MTAVSRGEQARKGVRAASRGGRAREVTARCGLLARGVLYVLVGVLALRVAFGDSGGKEADRQGALQELAGKPFGSVLVWAVGIGLVCMMLWRLSEAVFGAAGGVVAFSVLSFAAGGGGHSGDQQSRDATARALELPAGQWLVGAAGLGIAIAGVVIGVQAARRTFRKHLAMGGVSESVRKAVDFLGVAGGLARGVLFAAAGGFVVYAAVRFDPAQAKGMDDTLRSFTATPAGPWLLVVVAVGLMLFGAFSWAMARWREV